MLYDGKSHTVKDDAREKLLACIAEMDLAHSTRLPSENVLSKRFGVSRVTVRAVLDEMIAEGRVIRYHGSGSFVNPAFPKIKDCIYPFVLFEKLIREKGNQPRADNLGARTVPAPAGVAAELGIAEGAPVVCSRYAFYADEVFCLYCRNYFDRAILSDQDIMRLNTETSVLYRMLLDATGRIVTCDFVELTATDTTRTPELCEFVPEHQRPKPFLLMTATAFDQKSRPLIYSHYYYDTDYFRLGMVRNMRVDLNEYKNIVTRKRSEKG